MRLVLLLNAHTERDSDPTLWNELVMLMKEILSAGRRGRKSEGGRAGELGLNESMLDNGLSVVPVSG